MTGTWRAGRTDGQGGSREVPHDADSPIAVPLHNHVWEHTPPVNRNSSNNRPGLAERRSRIDRGAFASPRPFGQEGNRHPLKLLAKWAALRRSRKTGRPLQKRGLRGIFCRSRYYFIRFDAKTTSQNRIWLLFYAARAHTGADPLAVIVRGAGGRDCAPGRRIGNPTIGRWREDRSSHEASSAGADPGTRSLETDTRPRSYTVVCRLGSACAAL